jgi:histidyl-tRNA synthetase
MIDDDDDDDDYDDDDDDDDYDNVLFVVLFSSVFVILIALGTKVCFSRLFVSSQGLSYYTGVIFEAVLTNSSVHVGSVGGGGRYDKVNVFLSEKEKKFIFVFDH